MRFVQPRFARKSSASLLFVAIALALVVVGLVVAKATAQTVVATPRGGVVQIGGLTVGPPNGTVPPPGLAEAKAVLGKPVRTTRPSAETCSVTWRGGLRLNFVSFGGERSCAKRSLQSGTVSGHGWRAEIGRRTYRVGMPQAKLPQGAKRFPGYGYELATMPFIGSRTGTVFAVLGGSDRIRAFNLFIGGAGD